MNGCRQNTEYCFIQWKSNLIWIRREIYTDQVPSTSQNSSKHIYIGGFLCEKQQEMDWALLWILDSLLAKNPSKTKHLNNGVVFHKHAAFVLSRHLTDGLEWCRLLWCFHQLFGLSFWRHPFTSIGERVMQCYISPNPIKKQTHLHLGWPENEYVFSEFSLSLKRIIHINILSSCHVSKLFKYLLSLNGGLWSP